MLGSITPLGERGRGSRWWLTVSAYLVGSLVGGLLVGWTLGVAGATLGVGSWPLTLRLALIALALVIGALLDLRVGGLGLPTVHRQVDEEWRSRYRGWVWGLAFGFQLAVGVVTIVTTSTVYVTWLAAVGATFGLARALPIFAVAGVRTPGQLVGVDATLRRLAAPARRATYAAAGTIAALAGLGAVR